MRIILLPLVLVCLVCFGFWLSGFNFDARGETAVGCFAVCCFAAFVGLLLAVASYGDKGDKV